MRIILGNLDFLILYIVHPFRRVDKQNIKPKRKKTTSKGLSACEDDFDAVHLESAHAEKAKDR